MDAVRKRREDTGPAEAGCALGPIVALSELAVSYPHILSYRMPYIPVRSG